MPTLSLSISPHGRLLLEEAAVDAGAPLPDAIAARLRRAFDVGTGAALLHLVSAELQTSLPPSLSFARDLSRLYLTQLCHCPELQEGKPVPPVPPPADELGTLAQQAPPMRGLEYLTAEVLGTWWTDLDQHVHAEAAVCPAGVAEYLRQKHPLWHGVGRVTFHLAENKRDPDYPFAFLATYVSGVSAAARLQHLPLGRALQEYAGAKNRAALLALLLPVQRAAERSPAVKELVDSGALYQALAWTPRDAYRFLKDIPLLEESGVVVRVPDWWNPRRPPRPEVSVQVGAQKRSGLGAAAMLDFNVGMALDGAPLTPEEMRALLSAEGGLVPLRGRWVEVDRAKLDQALQHWRQVEREVRAGGISFFEGMRLLSGVSLDEGAAAALPEDVRQWSGVRPGAWLDQTLSELRDPQARVDAAAIGLRASLRPYQETGVNWLAFLTRLGLGACLADDMGLGKTIQVLTLLLHLRQQRQAGPAAPPSLLVVPASLIGNWKAEIARFAPALQVHIAHPSESDPLLPPDAALAACDLAITTYAMLPRLEPLRRREWRLVILDEAQAIKNSGTRQARAVKEASAAARIALTGTPIENRLSDLWSLFDFLNPGLLGGGKAFGRFVKRLEDRPSDTYGPLRALVRPYILRRLKTDRRIIADLPEKTEVSAYCNLSRQQAALYTQAVDELAQQLDSPDVEGIRRRGVVLAYLLRFKQICNHPSQWSGDGRYDPGHSGKFERLGEIADELAQRQEKALVFTQFRELTQPLADYLQGVFGRPGLVLHGQVAVGKRRDLVEAFQRDDGPPFFVLSLKAGGTGLNLTAAAHVIHFDRWWNPAVENQATDRAFRIGQKRNVMVHKFVCRGTVEDKIEALIATKTGLARDLLDAGGETLLTEMNNQELLRFVALDLRQAVEA